MVKVNIFDYNFISEKDFSNILDSILKFDTTTDCGILPIVSTLNVDQLIHLDEDKSLKNMIQKSYLILPDGQPIVWMSKFLKKPLLSKLSGSDLFPILWKSLILEQRRTLLIVPSEEVKMKLEAEEPSFLYYVPSYFSLENKIDYNNEVRNIDILIKEYNPEYIIIGLSYPKRERLCQSLMDLNKDEKSLYLLLGASFEFHIKMKKRAPIWMQKNGLEWLHRFSTEPKRLFKRYFVDSWYFLYLVLKEIKGNEK